MHIDNPMKATNNFEGIIDLEMVELSDDYELKDGDRLMFEINQVSVPGKINVVEKGQNRRYIIDVTLDTYFPVLLNEEFIMYLDGLYIGKGNVIEVTQ